jgi:transglutaminase-like putative cysteine protease
MAMVQFRIQPHHSECAKRTLYVKHQLASTIHIEVATRVEQFLCSSEYIDWKHPLVAAKAMELAEGCYSDEAIAKRCFEFVRDSIQHSWDYRKNPVTCKASEVLIHGTGYCYAKSHLLAALLRANAIPAGLCYQRLAVGTEGPPFCLHGLNAVHLNSYGWYRIDARGNKPGIGAAFSPPTEVLAFPIISESERDFPEILADPLPLIVKTLTENKTVELVFENLPDIEVIQADASLNKDSSKQRIY